MPDFSDFWSLRYAAGGPPVTQLFSQRIGAVCAYAAARLGLPPSAVTLLGACTFLVAALLFAALPDTPQALLLCLLVLQLGYGLDCADGQLARAMARTSKFGAWLDVTTDFVRNLLLTAAIVYWASQGGKLPLSVALAGGFTFCIGIVIKLVTLSEIRRAPPGQRLGQGLLRQGALAMMDTATFLAVLALLRPWPSLLLMYVAAMGCLYAAIAVRQAVSRIG